MSRLLFEREYANIPNRKERTGPPIFKCGDLVEACVGFGLIPVGNKFKLKLVLHRLTLLDPSESDVSCSALSH